MNPGAPSDESTPVLTRHTDVHKTTPTVSPTAMLPAVDWACIGKSAPVKIKLGARQPDDPLPFADIVIVTWTTAEWFALDHVFLNSSTPGDYNYNDDGWQKEWLPYTRGVAPFDPDPKFHLWGGFQMVEIFDASNRPWRVLLFKSNTHLAYSPWIDGLGAMVRLILEDTKADRIYSIGTAGGSRLNQPLGDAVITNAALLDVQIPQNLDADNGNMYRCPTWYPVTRLLKDVEHSLLYRMDQIVTPQSLEDLFTTLKTKHPGDPGLNELTLDDLLNAPLRPENLGAPKVQSLKDTPLLTTDFYYISSGNSADAYSVLEMDDAVIAREANKAGVRFASVRNISDTVIRKLTDQGTPISDAVRIDWSGLIYSTFGLQTSYNGALATWATIAGEGSAVYNPPRELVPVDKAPYADDPLEVKLAFQVRSCGTCSFFWPEPKTEQPYGPYTAFDFDVNVPTPAAAAKGSAPSPWVLGRTRPPSFPNGEVIDGCRKAPIMTIGINPNLTAFLPGETGAAWCYPNFSSDNDTNAWAKYAWYYRYRSVYQERFTLDFIKKFILPDEQVIATRDGHIVTATRLDDNTAWTVTIRYDGDPADTIISLPGKLGGFPFVLLFDMYPPTNVFKAGDVIAGKVAVPEGIQAEVMQQQQGYYMQFVPTLQQFQDTLHKAGHTNASLMIGEDVCHLDMVACASPHWNKGFLGGSDESITTIVDNCVSRNAWAIKQMVQTRPAVLYVVSGSSWDMFRGAFGAHVTRDIPISEKPVDADFTLLQETTDPAHPAYINFDVTIDGQRYLSKTRLVITPHFSYNTNFTPQYRISQAEWATLQHTQADCIAAFTTANGFTVAPPDPKFGSDYYGVLLSSDPAKAAATLAWFKEHFPAAYPVFEPFFCDPHALMASVLDDLYSQGVLSWKGKADGSGYLDRTEGSCRFCVNSHWQFPNECRYGKTQEPTPPSGFLEKVAEQIVATGKPAGPPAPPSDEVAAQNISDIKPT